MVARTYSAKSIIKQLHDIKLMICQQLLFAIKYSNKKDICLTAVVNFDGLEEYLWLNQEQ